MPALNEEYIELYTRAIGNAYAGLKRAVGNESTPGSALFVLQQLSSLALTGLPSFGVLASVDNSGAAGFTATIDTATPTLLDLTGGQVAYAGQVLRVAGQQISLARTFAPGYDVSASYGMIIGFPLAQAQTASQQHSDVTTRAVHAGDQSVSIANVSAVATLGFPIQAFLGNNTFIEFSGANAASTALQINPLFNNGNGAAAFIPSGTKIYFLYAPRCQALCGLPALFSGAPADFPYYPWWPSDWLKIAQVLIAHPYAPAVVTGGVQPSAALWPASGGAFSAIDAKSIAKIVGAARSSVRQVRDRGVVGDQIRAFEQYTLALSAASPTTLRKFYAQVPFRASTYFGVGVSFDNLERLEFSDNFCRAYFDSTQQDLQRTFGLFRGDLYNTGSLLTGAFAGSFSALSNVAGVAPSSLNRGTYTYGVTAVTSAGESSPAYASVVDDSPSATLFANALSWSAAPGALFYHIYRRGTLTGDSSEYRLTSAGAVTGSGLFANAQLVDTSNVALNFSAATSIEAPAQSFAIKIPVSPGSTQLGGVAVRLQALAAISSAANILVSLYSDISGAPGVSITQGTPIPFSALPVSGWQEFISQIDAVLDSSKNYWIILDTSACPPSSQISVATATAAPGGGVYAETFNPVSGASWNATAGQCYYRLLGWLDNGRNGLHLTKRGVKLTGAITLQPRQLSIYVPPVASTDITVNSIPSITGSAATNINNDLLITVIARLGTTGIPQTFTVSILQGTARGTRIPIGTASQIFDRIDDLQVTPGANLILSGSIIQWSLYDFITVEPMP